MQFLKMKTFLKSISLKVSKFSWKKIHKVIRSRRNSRATQPRSTQSRPSTLWLSISKIWRNWGRRFASSSNSRASRIIWRWIFLRQTTVRVVERWGRCTDKWSKVVVWWRLSPSDTSKRWSILMNHRYSSIRQWRGRRCRQASGHLVSTHSRSALSCHCWMCCHSLQSRSANYLSTWLRTNCHKRHFQSQHACLFSWLWRLHLTSEI